MTDEGSGQTGVVRSLCTGMPGLDAVLGGGLPEFSFNLIAGGPGSGKTTLAQQIVFGGARGGRKGLYFTVLGESTLKMLRYQGQFDFFDRRLVGSVVQFVNLSEEAIGSDPADVLARIVKEVEGTEPEIVVVDSFRSIARRAGEATDAGMRADQFVQQLALHLTAREVTSLLVGEYGRQEDQNPVFTVADGVLWLTQATDRNSVVRKLQVQKMRGRAPMPGLHTFRITAAGVEVFPRIPVTKRSLEPPSELRHPTGVPGLDEIMGGGIPAGDVVMLVGPAGSGKTTFATQFVSEAGRRGEAAVVAVFEEQPDEYLARVRARTSELDEMIRGGRLRLIYMRPLDLSVDETLAEIQKAVEETSAKRVVIDSLSGFEVALAPTFREDFRESLYRLVGALTAAGVTVFMTGELPVGTGDMRITSDRVSFITDDVIVQRYVEIGGRIEKVLSVVKMRGSKHSQEIRTYDLGEAGARVGGPLPDYHGILTGTPDLILRPARWAYSGLTDGEAALLDTLIRLGTISREALAARVAMTDAALTTALSRLVHLRYAEEAGDTVRAVAR